MNLHLTIASLTEHWLRSQAEERDLTPEAVAQGLLERALAVDMRPKAAASAEQADGSPRSHGLLPDTGEEEDPSAPWRGVFATGHVCETLFTLDLDVPLSDLPRRQPNEIFNPRWLDDDE